MKRGQIALEFISTYGFALMALIVALGALSYAGIFNFSSLQANECSFPEGARCLDYALATFDPGSGPAPYLQVILFNSYGADLTITDANWTSDKIATIQTCVPSPAAGWAASTNITIRCDIPQAEYYKLSRYRGVVNIAFRQTSGSYNYAIKGAVSIVAQ